MDTNDLRDKYDEYLKAIKNILFTKYEGLILPEEPETEDELFEAVSKIMEFSKELNPIIEQCRQAHILQTQTEQL